MIDAILLDTYAVLRIVEGEGISARAKHDIDDAARRNRVLISPISAWEIGSLVRKGKVSLTMEPLAWFERVLALPGIGLAEMPPRILIASAFLPGAPPADPADRIIVATARAEHLEIVTRDREILAYAAGGHVRASRC